MNLTLKIGRRHVIENIETVEECSRIYQKLRDESCEGASTFPNGKITGGLEISYNGRVWKGKPAVDGILVMEAQK